MFPATHFAQLAMNDVGTRRPFGYFFILFSVPQFAPMTLVGTVAVPRRQVQHGPNRAKDTWSVDLGTPAGLAKATLVVEAVAGFRGAEMSCGAVALPPSDVSAWIVEPEDGATLPFGKRISLIATLCDQNGRPMDWCDRSYTWRLDGKPLSRTSPQMMAWRADDPGTHRIDLIAGGAKAKRPKILASASVHVAQMTDAQAEFFDLIKARNELSAQNDGGTSP